MSFLIKVKKWLSLISWLFGHRKTLVFNHELLKDSINFRFWPYFASDLEIDAFTKVWDKLFEILKPNQVIDNEIIRIGSTNDGGYIVINDLNFPLVSIGIGDETSFDHEFCKRQQRVYQFDHTIENSPVCCSNPKFFQIGLGPSNITKRNLLSFEEIIRYCELTEPNSAILKVDIEGSEWDVFHTVDPKSLAPFRQLIIEFHGMDKVVNNKASNVMLNVLENLQKIYFTGFVNGNNNQPILEFNNKRIPHTFEISLFKRTLYKSSNKPIRDPHFFRNNQKLPMIHLS